MSEDADAGREKGGSDGLPFLGHQFPPLPIEYYAAVWLNCKNRMGRDAIFRHVLSLPVRLWVAAQAARSTLIRLTALSG